MQVDWFKVISDIEQAGMTHKEIAHHMDASRTSICNWKAGAEPRYGDGAMLIELWGLLTHRNPNELPYIRWNCERYRKR